MSNATAIGAVTATIQRLLSSRLTEGLPPQDVPAAWNLGGTRVTATPPDKARGPNDNGNQLNLFLYQADVSGAWRNTDLPGATKPGERGQPPLGLTLSYLLTAYGQNNDDTLAHILLGQAMRVLYDRPVLSREEIEPALPASTLHQQVERVRITSQPLSADDMSKLWTTFQTQYRISISYQVSVVLIESLHAGRGALPVLTRGQDDRGIAAEASLVPPVPTLTGVRPARSDPTADAEGPGGGPPRALVGDTLILTGHHLDRPDPVVLLRPARDAQPLQVLPLAGGSASELRVVLRADFSPQPPAALSVWIAGHYLVSVGFRTTPPAAAFVAAGFRHPPNRLDPDPEIERTTGERPLPLAPRIVVPGGGAPTFTVTPVAAGGVTIGLRCSPPVQPAQRVALLLGDQEIPVDPHPAPTDQLTFTLRPTWPGDHFVRLRVEGVDSLLVIRAPDGTLAFDDRLKVNVPA